MMSSNARGDISSSVKKHADFGTMSDRYNIDSGCFLYLNYLNVVLGKYSIVP